MRWALLGVHLFLLSCAGTVERSEDEESIRLSEELDSLSRKVQNFNAGPTIKEAGSFIDRTKDLGLDGLYAVAMNAIDLNFDGHTDLAILPTYYSRPKFFTWNMELNRFAPWDHDPLPQDFKASFMVFVDVNKDRIPDLISGVLNQRSEVSQIPLKIYQGKVEKKRLSFVELPEAIKLPIEPNSSVSLLDYDLDGWIDIFVSNWFENKNGQHLPVSDRLLRNDKGKFVDNSPLLKGETDKAPDQLFPPNARPTYGSSTCDVDQNGWPDILTVSSAGYRNKLWMNLRDPRSGERFFEDIGSISNYGSDPDGSLIPTGGGRTFFSACTDYNDDGLIDIFLGELSHAYDIESVDRSSVLTGSKETYPPYFLRTEYLSDSTSESWNQGDRRGVWVDYNLDGRVDILVDNSGFPPYSRLVLFEQDETRAFLNVSSQLGIDIVNPTGTIILDVNKDGLPDILTSQNNIRRSDIPPRLYLFENKTDRSTKKSLRIYLDGVKSNSGGHGAMVMLYSKKGGKNVIQRRWNETSQGGLPSQNESGVLFGVSNDTEIAGVKVRWPILKNGAFSNGEVLEKLYPIKAYLKSPHVELTLCEDGKILTGKMSCQF